jgi:hypothetical protein
MKAQNHFKTAFADCFSKGNFSVDPGRGMKTIPSDELVFELYRGSRFDVLAGYLAQGLDPAVQEQKWEAKKLALWGPNSKRQPVWANRSYKAICLEVSTGFKTPAGVDLTREMVIKAGTKFKTTSVIEAWHSSAARSAAQAKVATYHLLFEVCIREWGLVQQPFSPGQLLMLHLSGIQEMALDTLSPSVLTSMLEYDLGL